MRVLTGSSLTRQSWSAWSGEIATTVLGTITIHPGVQGRNGAPGGTGAAAERWPRRSCSPSAPGAGGETSGRCQLKTAELPAVHGEVACCATCDPVKLLVMLLRKRQWAMTSCRCLCWGPTSGSRRPRGFSRWAPTVLCSPQRVPRVFPRPRNARRCCCAAHVEALAGERCRSPPCRQGGCRHLRPAQCGCFSSPLTLFMR